MIMNCKVISACCVCFALLLSAKVGGATEHVFVRNQDGVWLVSDSLTIHIDRNGRSTQSTGCKVAISRGQLFFNRGAFRDVRLLLSQENALPFSDIITTKASIQKYLTGNHQDVTDPLRLPDSPVVQTGILQVEDGVFRAEIIGQTKSFDKVGRTIPEMRIGVPHGFGEAVRRINMQAFADSSVASRIAANPEQELLKMIKEEAIMHEDIIKAPFTVLLLRPDGTVSDFSDERLCTIPPGAIHIDSDSKNAASTSTKSR